MSTETPDRSSAGKPRFRDTLRGLPRRVWIISLGNLILQAGNFLPVFIVLYLTHRGHSAGTAGFVLGAFGLGRVFGNAVGGYLTDKISRRWTIFLSSVTTSGLTVTVPFLGSLPNIAVIVGLIGVMSQVYRPAAAAVLIDSVTTNQQRLAAFGMFRFGVNVGVALGGVLGGVLASISYLKLFLVSAATSLLFGLVVAVLLRDSPQPRPGQDDADTQADQAVGYRQALADRTLVQFLLMTVAAEFIYVQYAVGLPLHVSAVGLSAHDLGLLIGLNGLLVLMVELPILGAISRYRPERVLAVGTLLGGVGFALTGFTTGMVTLAATVLIWTLGEMMYYSLAQAHLASVSPPGMVGRYQGLYGAAIATGTSAGPVICGAVYAIDPWALWTLIGVLGLLSAQLSLRLLRPPSIATEPNS